MSATNDTQELIREARESSDPFGANWRGRLTDALEASEARCAALARALEAGIAWLEWCAADHPPGQMPPYPEAQMRVALAAAPTREEEPWEGEHCHKCGRPYKLVWAAEDDLWNEVIGHEGSTRCPDCFDEESRALDIHPFFFCHREHQSIPAAPSRGVTLTEGQAEEIALLVETALRLTHNRDRADGSWRDCQAGCEHGRTLLVLLRGEEPPTT